MADIKMWLRWHGHCNISDRVYFMNGTFNGMFYLDTCDFSFHFVHKFSCAQEECENLSTVCRAYKDAVYFFPTNAKVIMKYDLKSRMEQIIPIPDYADICFETAAVIQREQYIYIFPFNLGTGVYIFDLESQEVIKDTKISALFEAGSYCGNVFLTDDRHILLGMYNSDRLIEIDLDTKEVVYSKKLGENIKIYTICFDGNNYWILTLNSTNIYEWNGKNDELSVYTNNTPFWRTAGEGVPYSNLIFLENETLVLNAMLRNILRINKVNNVIEKPLAFPKGFQIINYRTGGRSILSDYIVLQDKVLLFPSGGNELLVYDKNTGQIEGKEAMISEKEVSYLKKVFQKLYMENFIYREDSNFVTLENLIALSENEVDDKLSNKRIGKLIYHQVKNENGVV